MIINLIDVLPKHLTKTYARRQISDIRYLVIHHTGVDMTGTPGEMAVQIARYHVNSLDWPGSGYHCMIAPDGTIMQTNYWFTVSYHIASRNKECIGICLVGDLTSKSPTDKQLRAMNEMIAYLKEFLPSVEVKGHKNLALPGQETLCPGGWWPD